MSHPSSAHDDDSAPDFTDVVHGEELHVQKSERPTFEIDPSHKLEVLGKWSPPAVLSKCSPSQLVTLSGAASGFLSGVVVCPFDVVKTRAQATGDSTNQFFKIFKHIYHTEGIRGFYRGLVPITIGYLPTWTIYFTVYERAKLKYPKWLQNHLGITTPSVSHVLSAVTAGMASSIAVNPIWVVKTRLMLQTGKGSSVVGGKRTYYHGTLDAFIKMYKQEGIKVFYSGLVPSLFGLVHVGIHFPVYEKLKQMLLCNSNVHDSSYLPRLILASSVSKMLASTVTYPHEILRTRMQMQPSGKKVGMLDTIKQIARTDGLRGFYAGYTINLIRTVPASAVTLVSFEYFKTYLLEISGHLKPA
ncbi:hypothetical protein DIURU_001883 [Diutina rugosa]|uniref:Mitochondrial thiamine pyrophosphate carrier 1 n=1 Tax=Diutina rugosa TaxID=5481 RepID=A0A642USI4_DIURU|nr:uncharacterized protein DIURU_001883 [Diutina rugosa]KAA8904607.1 hypothetical protein DIURU_001883 [Diutina rugosa]